MTYGIKSTHKTTGEWFFHRTTFQIEKWAREYAEQWDREFPAYRHEVITMKERAVENPLKKRG